MDTMLVPFQGALSDKLFQGNLDWNGNPTDWQTSLPLASDPQSLVDPAAAAGWGGELNYYGKLTIETQATAIRAAIGALANQVGFLQKEIRGIGDLYYETITQVMTGLDMAKNILSSPALIAGIKAVTEIVPIVGWILEILRRVALAIVSIISAVRNKRGAEMDAYFSKIPTFDYQLQFSRRHDETLVQQILDHLVGGISGYDPTWIAMPRYPVEGPSDFEVLVQDLNNDDYFEGYVVVSAKEIFEQKGGLGFIPGTRNIHGPMELMTRGCGQVVDIGSYWPTPTVVGATWWSTVLESGPTMFTVDTARASSAWKNYLESVIEFIDVSVKKGWTCSSRPDIGSHGSYDQIPAWPGTSREEDEITHKWGNIPNEGHHNAYRSYIMRLFFGLKVGETGWKLKDDTYNDDRTINFDAAHPIAALRNLHDRQIDTLQSLKCLYVNDELRTGGRSRWTALRNQSGLTSMGRQWQNNVKSVIEQSQDWKRADLRDVPPGTVRNVLVAKGLKDPAVQLGQTLSAGPSVLGDPDPPAPPTPGEVPLIPAFFADPARPSRPGLLQRAQKYLGVAILGGGAYLGYRYRKKIGNIRTRSI